MSNISRINVLVLLMASFSGLSQSKPKIDLQLSTYGSVGFFGTQFIQTAGVLSLKDSKYIQQSVSSDGILIGNNAQDSSKPHGSLKIAVMGGTQLTFHTQKGEVSIGKVQADITGLVADGNVQISEFTGRLNLFVKKGDIVADAAQIEGNLVTQNGDITLKNPTRKVIVNAKNGTTSVQFTTDYPLPKPIDYSLEVGEIYLGAVNKAAKLTLGQGNIYTDGAMKEAELSITQEGSIRINSARAGVKALTRKGNIELSLLADATTDEPVWIQTDEGNVVFKMPAKFLGTLEIEIVQTKDFDKPNGITSTLALPVHLPKNTLSPTGLVINRRIVCRAVFGTANRLVRIRVCNGNVQINQI